MITVLREELGNLPPSDRRLILVLAENPLARVSWIAAAAYADGSSSALAGHVRPGPWPLQGPASHDDAEPGASHPGTAPGQVLRRGCHIHAVRATWLGHP